RIFLTDLGEAEPEGLLSQILHRDDVGPGPVEDDRDTPAEATHQLLFGATGSRPDAGDESGGGGTLGGGWLHVRLLPRAAASEAGGREGSSAGAGGKSQQKPGGFLVEGWQAPLPRRTGQLRGAGGWKD